MKKPLVSVIVPVRNEAKLLPLCLASLKKQDTQDAYEILVVDTKSTDTSRDIAGKYGVRLISEPKRGKVYAFRKGASMARGDILCFTEADCIVPPHWIRTIVSYFASHPAVAAVSGTYTFHNSTPSYNLLARMTHPVGRWAYRILYRSDSLRCSNFAIRNTAYTDAGGFSERYYELYDVELGKRVRTVGQIHHIPDMEIRTSDRRFSGRIGRYLIEFTRSFTRNILLNNPIPREIYEVIR